MQGVFQSTGTRYKDSDFRQQLLGLISNFSRYEDSRNRERALKIVPVDELTQIAETRHNSCMEINRNISVAKEAEAIRDLLLLELLRWFKEEFFKWIDKPSCPFCMKEAELLTSSGNLSTEERLKSASRVEIYTCGACIGNEKQEVARFPRYNDPVVLLETRVGRCGEWANCFALICRSVGFETRHVTDWTDHVWVEVFSIAQNRWLHCDPCENKCDMPLLYELGWGKKLSYVIAVSHDDIQDVTWRYSHSKNHKDVLSRRNLVDERWLVRTLLELRKVRQRPLPPERLEVLQHRLVTELVSFVCPTKDEIKDGENNGRESGSISWRLARQEIRQEDQAHSHGFTWKITKEQISESKKLEFFYDPVQDEYFFGRQKVSSRKGWKEGLFELRNIARKEEKDWRMVYLARTENQVQNPGSLCWKFELSDKTESYIDSVETKIPCSTFHVSASITIEISTSTGEQRVIPDAQCLEGGVYEWKFPLNSNVQWVTVRCQLKGGSGSTFWQHCQLFRESVDSIRPDVSGPKFFPFISLNIGNTQ